ncbi:MAG: class I SAM-dependent methyltransferase, partial [Bacteroidota bacterium]
RDTLEKILADEKKICTEYAIGLVDERVRIAAEILNEYERLSTEDILKRLRIEYLIGDARNLSLQDNGVDLVNSNNTFEHVPPDVLVTILKEFKRVVKKGHGVMSHFIDMSDHFAHFDKSITIYNFLRYSDRKWKRIDNRIQPQNRLRIYDYHNMYQKLGIPVTEESFRKGKPEELKALMPNEKYLTRPLEETAISHCHFISLMK